MAISWALKRQFFYVGVLAAFLLVVGFILLYPALNRPPTCFDGKQNGDEGGIDCGGSCLRACPAQVGPISVLWSRAFPVAPGRYNAVALVENPNSSVASSRVNYSFRFADADNIYIGKRDGSTPIPPAGRFAIFEPAIDTGNSVPVYTTLELLAEPKWTQVEERKLAQLKILIRDIRFFGESVRPELSATVYNSSLFTIPDVSFVVILYDSGGNALATSSTYLEKLGKEENRTISFTWPAPIPGEVVAREIIPIFDIFLAELK
jgi:hypothetical protein